VPVAFPVACEAPTAEVALPSPTHVEYLDVAMKFPVTCSTPSSRVCMATVNYNAVVGRGGLEPPTSAITGAERCA
jgi:hypothetical protein